MLAPLESLGNFVEHGHIDSFMNSWMRSSSLDLECKQNTMPFQCCATRYK
ncbi:hypothetical protein APV28_0445 [Comamonas testosteroni]|nr:hypothetical protein APV28_0445 [Comamonas testosteroni]